MIRFVDMRTAEAEGYRFAFFSTVTAKFLEGFGCVQAWETVDELKRDFDSPLLDRLIGLIPDWVERVER